MFLQIRRVLDRRRGDADELAANRTRSSVCFTDSAVSIVSQVSMDCFTRMAATDDDAAARGIADDNFAGLAPVIKKRRFAVAQ